MAIGTQITAEEYARRERGDQRSELVRGEVVPLNPPGRRHCRVCARVSRLLGNFVEERNLGEVFCNDLGVVTERNPDTVRAADVAFFLSGADADESDDPGYGETPPFLIFEVASPSDRMERVLRKAAEYLAVGVAVVVNLDPARRTAVVFTNQVPVATFGPAEVLALPEPLAELRLTVGQWVQRPAAPPIAPL
ncbi:MAG TPA: Uma2 family endonuclease [Pirellulales bacterium]